MEESKDDLPRGGYLKVIHERVAYIDPDQYESIKKVTKSELLKIVKDYEKSR